MKVFDIKLATIFVVHIEASFDFKLILNSFTDLRIPLFVFADPSLGVIQRRSSILDDEN